MPPHLRPWAEMPRPIVCLAPMDGVTDSAYRRVVRSLAPHVVLFSEFTSADGFLRSERVRQRLHFVPEEHPYFVQLFGRRPSGRRPWRWSSRGWPEWTSTWAVRPRKSFILNMVAA